MKILIVEDDGRYLRLCRDTVERFNHEFRREIVLGECADVETAFAKLDKSYDAAIIDLKLRRKGKPADFLVRRAGNRVVRRIRGLGIRIPIAILTGTPDEADQDFNYVGIYDKADTEIDDLLDYFLEIYDSGVTKIMGGRGKIETTLTQVFEDNLMPQVKTWAKYGRTDAERAEKSLLRHAMNHLIQLIDDDMELCYPEEFYLLPPPADGIHTGSILYEKGGDSRFSVMSPACDLVIRDEGKHQGKMKTDRILVVVIESAGSLS